MFDVSINRNGQILRLTNKENNQSIRFHSFWLRDNSLDENTRSRENGQKLITLNEISQDVIITSAKIIYDSIEIFFEPEKKSLKFDIKWLLENHYDKNPNLT